MKDGMSYMIIHSHHRSEALALQHLAALRRKYASAELLSRRNALGRYSSRGRTYVFEVQEKKKKPGRTEYVIHFDYGTKDKKKGDRRIRFQVHVWGPASTPDPEVIEIIRGRTEGLPWPSGWRHKAIYWGKPKGDAQICVHRTDWENSDLFKTSILGGESSPAAHCRTGRKASK
jgi:hypothetical protein